MDLWERIRAALVEFSKPKEIIIPADSVLFRQSSSPNLHIDTEPFYVQKSFETGVHDLYRLCDRAKEEAAFLYSPSRQEWYNLVKELETGTID